MSIKSSHKSSEISVGILCRAYKTKADEKHSSEIYIIYHIISYHIVSYRIIVLKRQNCLKVGTDKPTLKVEMQSVSDKCLEKTSWNTSAKKIWYGHWQSL